MNISPVSVINFKGSTKTQKNDIEIKSEGDKVTYTMPRSTAAKVAPYLLPLMLGIGAAGCSKSDSNPVTPVTPPIEKVETTPVQKQVVNMWRVLGIIPSDLGKISSGSETSGIKNMEYYNTFFGTKEEITLHSEDSTKTVYYGTRKFPKGHYEYYKLTYTTDDDGNLVETSQTAIDDKPLSESSKLTEPLVKTYKVGSDNRVYVYDDSHGGELEEIRVPDTKTSIKVLSPGGKDYTTYENIKVNY